jgi:hypothetical protein
MRTRIVPHTGFKPPNTGKRGRKPGVPNRITAVLKDAIVLAATAVGEDGNGKNGLLGYLIAMARDEKRVFGALLARVIPLQTSDTDGGNVVVEVVRFTDPPSS